MKRFDFLPGVRRLFRIAPRTAAEIHAEIDEELASLLDARVDHLVARGMASSEARVEAVRRLGDSIDSVRDQLHHSAEHRERRMRIDEYLDDLLHDVRYAARALVRRPAFAAVTVLTLAVGIGATTAIFSAVNVLLVRPLPYSRPDQLMKVSLVAPADGPRKARDDLVWSYPKFIVLRDAQRVFSNLSLYTPRDFTITSGEVEQIRGESVGATYLRTLGLTPMRGRDFDVSVDAHPGADRQAIISYGLWQRRFNADPGVIGTTVDLDRNPYTVIGVGPVGFQGLTGHADLFVPITIRPAAELTQAQMHSFYLVARRRPDVDVARAVSAVGVLGAQVRAAFPDSRGLTNNQSAKARPLDDARVAPLIRQSLFVLFGAVGFVLLIACVNVANLSLGRANARRREIAVRLAIGAGRARLVRLLLAESLLLALIGGAASIVVAWAGTHALSTINPAVTSRAGGLGGLGAVSFSAIHLDWMALLFTFAVALVVGVVFGLVPALDATRASLGSAMKGDFAERSRGNGRRLLVVVEVALALMLLAGSGLMIRSLSKLLSIDPGFDGRNVLTLRLTIPSGGLADDSMPDFYVELLDRLRALPGVADAALNNCPPLNGGCSNTRMEFLDRAKVPLSQMPSVGVHWASATWFVAMRVPLKHGRFFGATDRLAAPKVVLINETAARAFWPNENPLGKRIGLGMGGFGRGAEVVGVVGDVRQTVDSAAKPDVYIPYSQSPSGGMMIFIRTKGKPATLAADVRRAIHELAPRYPIYDIQPMTTRAAGATAQTRFNAVLLALFAATALSLAVVGVYGVMSLAVAARTREIGVRIALGADHRRVQRLVVGDGIAMVSIGAAIGLVGALVTSRVLQKLLFDLKPTDPLTYVAILLVLAAATTVASWIPARRASRVDPVVALRAD